MGGNLAHYGMEDDPGRGGCKQRKQNEREDEEGSLLARLFGWLGDAKGIDESVGEEVEEAHTHYYAPIGLVASNAWQRNRIAYGLAADALRR